jgi:hypothetical protein
MIPTSIVEQQGFIDFVRSLDPSFKMPTRHKIKQSGLPGLKEEVDASIKARLAKIDHPNVSIDGWCDPTLRSFNGYIAQGRNKFFGKL